MIVRDEERYATLLRLVGSLSRLFSDNDSPYIDSRFAERLFVQTTGARDLGRMDISFDAVKLPFLLKFKTRFYEYTFSR